MAAVGAIFGVLGSVVSAVGSIVQGNAAKAAAERNAENLELQAKSEREAAAAEASDYRRMERRKLSYAQAMRASQGVALGAGSPLLVTEDTVRNIALGAGRLGHAGVVKGVRLSNEAEMERYRGKMEQQAGYFGAGASLLSGFGSLFG